MKARALSRAATIRKKAASTPSPEIGSLHAVRLGEHVNIDQALARMAELDIDPCSLEEGMAWMRENTIRLPIVLLRRVYEAEAVDEAEKIRFVIVLRKSTQGVITRRFDEIKPDSNKDGWDSNHRFLGKFNPKRHP